LSQTNNYLAKNSSTQIIANVTKVIDKTVEVLESVQSKMVYDSVDVKNSIEIINSILKFPDDVFNDQKTISTK
jgi:hypothetical protein